MLADVLINVSTDEDYKDPTLDFGLSVAKAFDAHATGVAFGVEPTVASTYFGAVPGEFMIDLRNAAEKAAKDAAARFLKAAQGAGVDADSRAVTSTLDGCLDAFGRLARLYDVTVIGQPNPDRGGSEAAFLEAGLFESGRSILIAPYIQKEAVRFDRVMVAWDGGRPATRAIAEAHPFLAKAKQVEILVVQTGKPDSAQMPGSELAKHLARHKLKVELRHVQATSASEIDSTILNEITDSSIDLVVMGGYGHSRLRQFVLGGVTRGVIRSMTAPVLMAH